METKVKRISILKGFKNHPIVKNQISKDFIDDEMIDTIIDNYLKRREG